MTDRVDVIIVMFLLAWLGLHQVLSWINLSYALQGYGGWYLVWGIAQQFFSFIPLVAYYYLPKG